jgi:hypothetical protein
MTHDDKRIYVLNSRGPEADHKVHEIADYADPFYPTICGKLAVGPRYHMVPVRLNYCQECFEAKR